MDSQSARELAQHVEVSFRGSGLRTDPTIEVRDRGIGIHPSEFADSILALGQSDKGQKSYLVGMYGQGGSSTFDKCDYTIIVSRRHPEHLTEGETDEIGWTVVRKSLNVRAPVYSYLRDPGTDGVPVFSGALADSVDFSHGTIVAHIGYRNTGGFASAYITNNAWYTLNFRLFEPLLPWTLVDRREGIRPEFRSSRTMRGVPYRVGQIPSVDGLGLPRNLTSKEPSAVRHHIRYRHELPSGSSLWVEWWVMQDEQVSEGRRRRQHEERARSYRDRTRRYSQRVIAITRGGQTHAALTSNIFRRKRLRQVARSVVVQVDTDSMTYEEGASFFASNRADLKTASEDLVVEAITAAIDLHLGELREIEREREQEIVSGRGASDEDAIRSHLDPMIRAFQRRRLGSGSPTDRDQGGDRRFQGRQIPTYLRFARTQPLKVRPGVPTRIDLLTDADDSVVRDRRTVLRLETSHGDGIRFGSPIGGSGRYRVNLTPSADLAVGTQIDLSASIAQSGLWHKDVDRPCKVEVVAPPEPYVGTDPPTFIRFRSQNGAVHVRRGGARVSIETDAVNDLTANGGRLTVLSPDAQTLPVLGASGPSNGEFKVGMRIPSDAPLGDAGNVTAVLALEDGSVLLDQSALVIEPELNRGGQDEFQSQPNYEIKDVVEIRLEDDDTSWADMPDILSTDEVWNGQDVAAFLETGEEHDRKVIFYLNSHNEALREVERQIAQRQSENSVDSFRARHRTLLCFHLYKLAIQENVVEATEYHYRNEMIRVSETLLFTHRQFMDQLEVAND